MDFPLLSDPSDKPWCNIVANSIRVTGDGTFGSTDVGAFPITGDQSVVCFTGYRPNRFPNVRAGTLDVGSTFAGNFHGTTTNLVPDTLHVDMYWGAVRVMRVEFPMLEIFPPPARQLNIGFSINCNVAGPNGLMECQFTAISGGNVIDVRAVQGTTPSGINTTFNHPISLEAHWDTTDPGSVLLITSGYMRRIV